jgi:hypothetical protein
MPTKKLLYPIIIMAVFSLCLKSPRGQIVFGSPTMGDIQVVYSRWNLQDKDGSRNIDQFSVPVTGFVPLKDNLEARFYLAGASSNLSFRQTDYSLTGMSDFRCQISQSLSDDRLLLSAGINLPTGKRELSLIEERAVIEALADNYLSFPIRSLGEGFGFNLLVGGAMAAGIWRLGAGIMYQYNGSFSPYEYVEEYDPGDFISCNVSGNVKTGKTTLTADIIYNNYTTDKLGGENALKQSPTLDFRLGAGYVKGSYILSSNVRYLFRGKNKRYNIINGDLLESLKMYGNEFYFNGAVAWYANSEWYVAPSLELKLIAGDDRGFDHSNVAGIAGTFGRKAGKNANLSLTLEYFTGSADGGKIDVSGLQLTTGMQMSF